MKLYKLFKSVSVKGKLHILKTLIQLPGMLLHELSHSIVASVLFLKWHPIKCNYFYKMSDGVLYSYSFQVETNELKESNTNRIKLCIVNIAPIISIVVISILKPAFLIYLIISFKTLIPSKGDFKNFALNISNIHHHNNWL